MKTTNSISAALIAARDSLNAKNFHKGSYFSTNKYGLCMCAHGGLQAQVNPKVKAALATAGSPGSPPTAAERRLLAGAAVAEYVPGAAAVAMNGEDAAHSVTMRGSTLETAYNKRSRRMGLDAHYICGMVGLTTVFNDAPGTTVRMVKAKFTQAAKLAEKLCKGQ